VSSVHVRVTSGLIEANPDFLFSAFDRGQPRFPHVAKQVWTVTRLFLVKRRLLVFIAASEQDKTRKLLPFSISYLVYSSHAQSNILVADLTHHGGFFHSFSMHEFVSIQDSNLKLMWSKVSIQDYPTRIELLHAVQIHMFATRLPQQSV
jgi:hypothetical protein